MNKKEIKSKLLNAFDTVRFNRDNRTIVARRSYFYHNGQTADNLALGILKLFPTATIVGVRDQFRQWPAESYFQINFTVEELV